MIFGFWIKVNMPLSFFGHKTNGSFWNDCPVLYCLKSIRCKNPLDNVSLAIYILMTHPVARTKWGF